MLELMDGLDQGRDQSKALFAGAVFAQQQVAETLFERWPWLGRRFGHDFGPVYFTKSVFR